MIKYIVLFLFIALQIQCTKKIEEKPEKIKTESPFVWEAANLYFLMTDRFNNGNTENDVNFDRTKETGKLRGFEGGDLLGIIQKIEDDYFTDLGINAIWFTPVVEQIHGFVDEGTGVSYGFHGYWTKDWTALDPNFGTKEDLKKLVEAAHKKGIRIVLDGVINHTGPVTEQDPVWPEDWVRTDPTCTYQSFETTTACTLVKNLPDLKTETEKEVDIPAALAEKWKAEGRYEQEMKELDEFFERTGYKRTPTNYIIKWLTDYILEFGIDGYRADTVKHTEPEIWLTFKNECDYAFEFWKQNNPELVLDDNDFYMVGEVYNYAISNGKLFDFGDKKVNYFENGFRSLINFEFKSDANKSYEELFSKYDSLLHHQLAGFGTMNYVSSHDDSGPFDKERKRAIEAGTKLLLCPGTTQVYYGDESARSLVIEGTQGDATLRSFMNWEEISTNPQTKEVLAHWQKLGKFRANHPAIGAGKHELVSEKPYFFKRTYTSGNYVDEVLIGLDLNEGEKEIQVAGIFNEGETLIDAYSNSTAEVKDGKITINSPFGIVLLELK
ncbi:alpha-amylase family glycosyl hydrolase [Namhaeicola litoreus]|uniref:Alpha-amylase family glycosyl hydrolase n=1 Tax=Namhaeicola litoreus TaxID=1052145 RepID=A0ABW3XZ20_9FLAO